MLDRLQLLGGCRGLGSLLHDSLEFVQSSNFFQLLWAEEKTIGYTLVKVSVMKLMGCGNLLKIWDIGDRSDWESSVYKTIVNEHVGYTEHSDA